MNLMTGNAKSSLRFGAFLTALVLMLAALLPPVPAGGTGGEPTGGARAYTPHDPIVITKDSEFTAQNGVTGGGSSYSDPYIISGWEFSPSGKDAIKITMAMMPFKIKDCKFKDAGAGYAGIFLTGADSNGIMTGNVFENNDLGVKIMKNYGGCDLNNNTFTSNSKAVLIEGTPVSLKDNTFTGGQTAIALDSASSTEVSRNSLSGVGTGIAVEKKASGTDIHDNNFQSCTVGISHGAVVNEQYPNNEAIFNNTFTGTTTGITLSGGTTQVNIYRNEFNGGNRGTEVSSSNSNAVNYNLFSGMSSYGIYITGSTGNYLHHNNFIGNNGGGTQAFCDNPDNAWSDDYAWENWWNKQSGGKGNHWSDKFLPDEDKDGYTDSPYSIAGSTCKDSYVLTTMVPYGGLQGKPLSATAIIDKAGGAAPLAVNFIPDVLGGVIPFSYSWQFGDGGTSSIAFPSHTYNAAGTYQAKFTVTDKDGKTAESPPLAITVTGGGGTPLAASASPDKSNGAAPLAVSFTGTASGGTSPYTYNWDFGDGASGTGATASHTYNTAGTYSVVLTVTDSASGTKKAAALTITVTSGGGGTPLSALASADKTSGAAPLSIQFTGTASGGSSPYTFSWSFGDGSTGTGSPASHTYNSEGVYDVILTVADSKSATKTAAVVTVTVGTGGGGAQMTVAASASPATGPAPLNVLLVATASGGIGPYTYEWAFGDGTNGTGATLNHRFQSKGTYTALVTVRDSAGHQRASTVSVVVKDKVQTIKPQPGFEVLFVAAALAIVVVLVVRKRKQEDR